MNEIKTNITKDLNELCKIAKNWVIDLDKDQNNPLIVKYIFADDDLINKWDNTPFNDIELRNSIIFIYNYTISILNEKYKSQRLSMNYENKELKFIYIIGDIVIKVKA